MGCCVSTHENRTIPKHSSLHNNPHQFPCVSKSPPRAEEEAVKEVLSETPKPKPRPRPRPESPIREHLDGEPTKSKLLLLTPKKAFLGQNFPTGYPDPYTPEEISEVSEMCSFSESISTTTLKEEEDHRELLCTKETNAGTTTTTSGGEVRQRVYRSQGYNGNYIHQQHHYNGNNNYLKNQGRSPARRRPEPSPPRRRQPGPGAGGLRREMVGDNSGRRSQSPGVRGNVGRSPSARKTGPSPGRVRMVHGPENGKRMENDEGDNEEEIGLRRESEEWQGPKESLENPLVSLECFIFL